MDLYNDLTDKRVQDFGSEPPGEFRRKQAQLSEGERGRRGASAGVRTMFESLTFEHVVTANARWVLSVMFFYVPLSTLGRDPLHLVSDFFHDPFIVTCSD